MDPEISIVVPFHNEGPNVLPLVRAVFTALSKETAGIELLLIDDGSADDTWERMLESQRADSRVRILRHGRNAGQSAALGPASGPAAGRSLARWMETCR